MYTSCSCAEDMTWYNTMSQTQKHLLVLARALVTPAQSCGSGSGIDGDGNGSAHRS